MENHADLSLNPEGVDIPAFGLSRRTLIKAGFAGVAVAQGLLSSAFVSAQEQTTSPENELTEQIVRLSGGTREATAIEVSRHKFKVGSDDQIEVRTQFLATSVAAADCVAISPLVTQNDVLGPVLLLNPHQSLDSPTNTATLDALHTARYAADLEEEGYREVVVLGGTAALPAEVDDWLAGNGFIPYRLAGATRYETAAQIEGYLSDPAYYLFSDETPALALIGAAMGANIPRPNHIDYRGTSIAYSPGALLLMQGSIMPDITMQTVRSNPNGYHVVIGDNAIAAYESRISETQRGSGESNPQTVYLRGTPAAIAVEGASMFSTREVTIVNGDRWPDGLVAGSLGKNLLYTMETSLFPETDQYLRSRRGEIDRVIFIGGEAVIAPQVLDQVNTILF